MRLKWWSTPVPPKSPKKGTPGPVAAAAASPPRRPPPAQRQASGPAIEVELDGRVQSIAGPLTPPTAAEWRARLAEQSKSARLEAEAATRVQEPSWLATYTFLE